MIRESIQLSSLKIKFEELLTLIDTSIEKSRPIQISENFLNQKNTNIKFLKWLHKHKIIELTYIKKPKTIKKRSIQSRERKIEISVQLKALGLTNTQIAQKFRVKSATVGGYFKAIKLGDNSYLNALKISLSILRIDSTIELNLFPIFPIRISYETIRKNLSQIELKNLETIVDMNPYIRKVTGRSLGTSDLSLELPLKVK